MEESLKRKLESACLWPLKREMIVLDFHSIRGPSFTLKEIDSIKKQVATQFNPGFVTADRCLQAFPKRFKTITFDCPGIDSILGGGLPTRGVTELYGASSVGKTQICLQLAVCVQYPEWAGGLNKGAVYVCTEDQFPSSRLSEIAGHTPKRKKQKFNINYLDNVLVNHSYDAVSFRQCVLTTLPTLLKSGNFGLVIIDSIAALFRSDYSEKEWVKRSEDLRKIGIKLHSLASEHGLAILCVNQVTDSLDSGLQGLPALGLTWSNIVTTRLKVTAKEGPQRLRTIALESSSHLPSASCGFTVKTEGVTTV